MKAKTIKILEAMDNWQTLSNIELNRLAGWRFWWHLYSLRKAWVTFKKTKWERYIEYFTIISIPSNVIYKNRNSIKIITISLLDRIYNFLTK